MFRADTTTLARIDADTYAISLRHPLGATRRVYINVTDRFASLDEASLPALRLWILTLGHPDQDEERRRIAIEALTIRVGRL